MAEFKLGRIRFVWQGEWTTGQTYAIDDVISKGGKSYICVVNHVASPHFVTDLEAIPTKWNVVADGTTWRGDWQPNEEYDAGDEVKYGGIVYICDTPHSSAGLLPVTVNVTGLSLNAGEATITFNEETPAPFPVGSNIIVSDVDPAAYNGTHVVTSSTTTSVTFETPYTAPYVSGGTVYTFGGLEASQDLWTAFAEAFNYRGEWDVSTRYSINDFVQYGGFVYVCTAGHISASTVTNGLEANQGNWEIFNNGIVYLGNWSGSSVRYKLNDVVKYGSGTWICTQFHTSSTTFDISKWEQFTEGFEFENSWSSSTIYQIGDTVTYGGYSYIAKTNNTNKQPTSYPSDWEVFTTGFNFRSEWDVATAYKVGDVVRLNGYTYVASADTTGVKPPSTGDWSRLNSGFYWTDNPQTYSGVAATNVTGSGSGVQFDVVRSGTVYTVSITSGQAGINYANGNIVKILGSSLGGITPANDLLITITGQSGGSVTTVTWTGRSVTWTSGTVYVLGDAVLFGGNSYICIQTHTAATGNKPDNDITATYWNVLTIGSEVNVLTTEGDMIYYGPNGPTRLPVGVDGQILRSTNGFPAWANYGLINNLVYVGPLGIDEPAPSSGLTIDKPWKTIRYANKQVEEGYINPQARTLLQKNKQFLIKEVDNYMYYTCHTTITSHDNGTYEFTCDSTAGLNVNMPIVFSGTALGGITIGTTYYVKTIIDSTHFTISNTYGGVVRALTGSATGTMEGRLSYSRTSTERDAGHIIDAIIYDMSRGGTAKTVAAGRAYFTAAGNNYITTNTRYLVPNFIQAHVHLKNILENVLSNTVPMNYQALNGISSADRAPQIFDSLLTAESGALTYLRGLVDIISEALDQGSATALPTPTYPNTTIMIKTGTYSEVLPIYVPENTALVGDELRTSVVQPAQPIDLLATDKSKTISAIERIKDLIPDIISNTSITPTAGNTATQQYIGGFAGSSTATTRIGSSAAVISDILTGGLSSTPAFTLPTPTAGNYGATSGYFNAARLLDANKAFLKAEVTAWINEQVANAGGSGIWNGFVYDQTPCERDVGYVVEALVYDLTYGGNLATQIAARSYYSNGVLVETGEEAQALALWAYVKTIVDDIATGTAITPTTGNGLTQDVSGTPGSAPAGTYAASRIQELYNTIDTGDEPVTIAPETSWVTSELLTSFNILQAAKDTVKAGAIAEINRTYPTLVYNTTTCSRDVGYIVDAISYDVLFGGNYLSAKAGMAYYRGTSSAQIVINNQLTQTEFTVNYIRFYLENLVKGVTGSQGNAEIVSKVEASIQTVYDILASGLTSVPTLVIPDPANYNTASLTHTAYGVTGNTSGSTLSYGDSRAQVLQNYAFIKAEISAWLADATNGYDTLWSSIGATAQAACIRDIGYILDAIRYDITYGGNTQSIIAGGSYFSNNVLVIPSAQLAAELAALGRLKSIVGTIAQDNIVLPVSPGNTETQVTTGTVGAGGAYAALFLQDRIQDVIDYITNSTAPTTIEPCTSWVDSELVTAVDIISDKRDEIASDATAWIKKFYQEVAFDADLSTRDAGLVIDAVSYDLLLGTNFNAIKAGMAYYRGTSSAQTVIASQKSACLGAMHFMKYKIAGIAASGAAVQAQTILGDVTKYIQGGAVIDFVWPDPSNILAPVSGAARLVQDNKSFIQAEIISWITVTYPGLVYSPEACNRDVGYIIDALVYDLRYGGNYASKMAGKAYYSFGTSQIFSSEKTATLASYGRLKDVVQAIAEDITVTASAGNTVSQVRADVNQVVGGAAAANSLGLLVDIITDIIDLGETLGVPKVQITTIAGGTTLTTGAAHGLKVGDTIVPQVSGNGLTAGTTYYVVSTPLTTTITVAASWAGTALTSFTDGTGLGIDAEVTVVPTFSQVSATATNAFTTLSGTASTIKTNVSNFITEEYPTLVYNSVTCLRDVGYIIDAIGYDFMLGSNFQTVKSAMSYYRAQASLVVGDQKRATVAAFRFLRTQISTSLVNYSTQKAQSRALMATLIDIVDQGINDVVETYGTVTYNNTLPIIKGAEILRINADFLAEEATAWVNIRFGDTVSSISGSGVTTNSPHNYSIGDPVIFTGTSAGGITAETVYYVKTIPDASSFTLSTTRGGTAITLSSVLSPVLTVNYYYDEVACKRDMKEFVLALVYDLQWTGNYKSLRAARLYKNAVEGSTLSDMFYVRNACGVRNMTLNGLNGDLTEENDYGTKRPTAGAYTSLDPGFGPNDSAAWVTLRSCYCQNVSLFGTGCTGMKIDGALHSGGNRSIVANDYTTILSDGIGVWCTGHNSLTELVSVFCYYSYSGYLAELGGRMRATNGNSSYGVYGVIAEGTDTEEIPFYGNLDNRAADAVVQNVLTDGINKVQRFEYLNAGIDYTNVDVAVSGTGYNVVAIQDEFRDSAMFETRLIDRNDGQGYGGADYGTAINAAQLGDLVSITISATDTALSTAYVGMRVHITAGSGVGQYANILEYSNGSKVAKVYKDSFATLTVTGSDASADTLTVASTATLYTDMPIYLSTAIGGASATTAYYVRTIVNATTFTIATAAGAGSNFDITATTSGQTVTLYAAGWDHIIPGTAIVTPLDLTTTYIIEPRINYSAPGYTSTARTLSATTTWGSVGYGDSRFVALATGGTATSYSTTGTSWTAGGALPSSGAWITPVFGGGSGATATATVGGLGGWGAVLVANLGSANSTGAAGPDQVASITVVNGGYGYTSPPTIVFTSATGSNAVGVAKVLNGEITSVSVEPPDGGSYGSGYLTAPGVTAVTDRVTVALVNTYGRGYLSAPTVTFSGGGSSNQATGTAVLTSSSHGVYEITIGNDGGSGYTSAPTITVTDATAAFVTMIPGTTSTAYLLASSPSNTAWTSGGALPATTFADLAYGNGIYVAVGGTSSAASTGALGAAWVSRTIPTLGAGTYSAVEYGGSTFVAISTGNTATAYSTNGTSWTAGGALPASTTWTSMAYGNGRFVALAATGRVAYSLDFGVTWTNTPSATGATTSILSSSLTWSKVSYGQGLFFAIATGTSVCATSPDGITWTVRAMPSSSNWSGVAFGNPSKTPIWTAVSSTSGQIAASIKTGAQALGRMRAVSGEVLEVRIAEPGSGYPKGTVSATTATTNLVTVDETTNLVDSQPIEFTGLDSYGLTTNVTYYVIGSTITSTQFKVSATAGSSTAVLLTTETTLSGTYRAGPIVTQYDPNKTITAGLRARMGDGTLANPTFTNRGTLNTTATALLTGDGYADFYQASNFISVRNLFDMPEAGSNIEFASIPGEYYKLVTISNILSMPATGSGNYTAVFQISPALTVLNAPAYNDNMTITIKYSQVRLTGHDFLYIGTGNQADTNYPYVDPSTADINKQTLASNGGRVFFTSTDQDGNFNVGNLFGVQQATGTATLNANAFNLSGLQSLQLSGLSLGVGSAVITQFSTDPYFTANSDNILPTQRAIKSYITAQIGGGLSQLNVNTLTAGVVYIANNTISTTSGGQLNVTAKMNFTGGIDGAPVALGFFLSR